ncbi:MAG: phosphatidylserine decarboxylase [Candidatus Omnitrophica bacterium]|nr:phosphatidylserine decarboxylase [Candidatus Omnitrophota bacterium]
MIVLVPGILCGCQTLSSRPLSITEPDRCIISPAEGVISSIVEIKAGDVPEIKDAGKTAHLKELQGMLTEDSRLVLIFMNPLNYHGVHSPLNGTVASVSHTPGTFKNLYKKGAYLENERACIVIDGSVRVAIIPVAGFLYRRIRLNIASGNAVPRGASLGRILWGSAVGVVIPSSCPLRIKEGDRVRAGKSIIAELAP